MEQTVLESLQTIHNPSSQLYHVIIVNPFIQFPIYNLVRTIFVLPDYPSDPIKIFAGLNRFRHFLLNRL
jgi:hypothetical protein